MRKQVLAALCSIILTAAPVWADEALEQRAATLESEIEDLESQLSEKKAELEALHKEMGYFAYTVDDKYTIKYLRHEVIDSNLCVYFEFTNGDVNSISPYFSMNVKAYQNGVELDPNYSYGSPNIVPEADVTMKDVLGGATVDVAFIYKLNDMSEVTIETFPILSIGEVEHGFMTLTLE